MATESSAVTDMIERQIMRKPEATSSWTKNLGEGLFFLAATGGLFWYFLDFENSHDPTRRIQWFLAILYNIGGKWLVCGVMLLLAILEFREAARKKRGEGTSPAASTASSPTP